MEEFSPLCFLTPNRETVRFYANSCCSSDQYSRNNRMRINGNSTNSNRRLNQSESSSIVHNGRINGNNNRHNKVLTAPASVEKVSVKMETETQRRIDASR